MNSASHPRAGTQGTPDIPALTGVRAIAAFSIAAGHIYPPVGELTLLGMPLFFTLSGFIIHYVYADTFAGSWRKAALAFAGARFSRIYPLYAALLVVAILTTQMGRDLYNAADFRAMAAYVFACWTWLPLWVDGKSAQDWYYSISWSIPTEIFFYVSYALVFYRVAGIRRAKTCFIALIALCAGAYAWFYFLFLTRDIWEGFLLQHFSGFPSRTENLADSVYRWFLYISPNSRIFEFVGGCLTCQLFLLLRRDGQLDRDSRPRHLGWLAVALIAVILFAFDRVSQHQPWLTDHSATSFFMILNMNFLLAPFCYALLFSLAVGGSVLARLLSSSLMVLAGTISYSTYLGHPLATMFIRDSAIGNLHHTTILKMVAAYVFSWMFYVSLEVPAKTLLRRLFAALTFSRRPSAAAGLSDTAPDRRPAE
ncbi:MAG: acyltransferase [Stellaceae bacterium]